MARTREVCIIFFVHKVTKSYQPVAPPWLHNDRWSTLDRSFYAKGFSCFCCTRDLGEEYSKLVFCQGMVFLPVTLTCLHSVSRSSLCKSSRARIFSYSYNEVQRTMLELIMDRKVGFTLPELEGRTKIVKINARSMGVEKDIRHDLPARLWPNCSGAEIRSVCTEAGMFATRARRKVGDIKV